MNTACETNETNETNEIAAAKGETFSEERAQRKLACTKQGDVFFDKFGWKSIKTICFSCTS